MNKQLQEFKSNICKMRDLYEKINETETTLFRKFRKGNYKVSKRGRIYPVDYSGAVAYIKLKTYMCYLDFNAITSIDEEKKLIRIR